MNGEEVQIIELDTSTSTTYTITYRATNQGGATGEATRTVVVEAPASVADDSAFATDGEAGESENAESGTASSTPDTATSTQSSASLSGSVF